MAILTIQLPNEFESGSSLKIIYDQHGQPSEVLLPYETFQKMMSLLQSEDVLEQPSQSAWQNQLLTLSAWSEEELEAVNEARELINQWRPVLEE